VSESSIFHPNPEPGGPRAGRDSVERRVGLVLWAVLVGVVLLLGAA
jgi:hypothetical protein